MRPVCLLDRTKNLHQSDRLHFISDSQDLYYGLSGCCLGNGLTLSWMKCTLLKKFLINLLFNLLLQFTEEIPPTKQVLLWLVLLGEFLE